MKRKRSHWFSTFASGLVIRICNFFALFNRAKWADHIVIRGDNDWVLKCRAKEVTGNGRQEKGGEEEAEIKVLAWVAIGTCPLLIYSVSTCGGEISVSLRQIFKCLSHVRSVNWEEWHPMKRRKAGVHWRYLIVQCTPVGASSNALVCYSWKGYLSYTSELGTLVMLRVLYSGLFPFSSVNRFHQSFDRYFLLAVTVAPSRR